MCLKRCGRNRIEKKKDDVGDLMKQKLDFMTYMEPEFNWFSMTFLLVLLPLFIVFEVLAYCQPSFKGETVVLSSFVTASGIIHFIFFCVRNHQYTLKPKSDLNSLDGSVLT